MTTHVLRYRPADFEKIMFDGFAHSLSPQTIQKIQTIADQVGAPEYIRTPQFPKRDRVGPGGGAGPGRGGGRRRNRSQEITDDDWEAIRQFQATELAKKEGIEASIDKIRKELNKLSAKTYCKLRDEIFAEIRLIIGDVEEPTDELLAELNKVGNAIFGIASSNAFYSDMYAQLYFELMETFRFMKKIFNTNFNEFRSLFETIEYCDPGENYDKFCDNNKTNEKRRAVGLFYVNLMKKDVIEEDSILEIIVELQAKLASLIPEEGQREIVEELSEVLYILITNSAATLDEFDAWPRVLERATIVSKMKIKSNPSISNKTIFKHMDILDELNN